MADERAKQFKANATGHLELQEFQDLSSRILNYLNHDLAIRDFLKDVCVLLADFFGCDAVELRIKNGFNCTRAEAVAYPGPRFRFETPLCEYDGMCVMECCADKSPDLEKLFRDVVTKRFEPTSHHFTQNGSFWTGDTDTNINYRTVIDTEPAVQSLILRGEYKSIAVVRLEVGDKGVGLLVLRSRNRDFFTKGEIEFCESVGETVGLSLVHQTAQIALGERVKELMCLYGIAKIVEQPDISLEEILNRIVELLPPGWQYPQITYGRIILDGRNYSTSSFQENWHRQTAIIVVKGVKRGVVEVAYSEARPEIFEGPFLKEERNLIEAIARQIAQIVERREAEEDKEHLEDQLRHADRLATIGQLAAGIAHELNEPLGGILGFAQLATKAGDIPNGVRADIEKIVASSLYAREVIKKLLLFSRQVEPSKTNVNLNKVVEEGLFFFEARCAKEGIDLKRSLASDLPEIGADRSQLNQVLVNLVVNAIQAMPEGGSLTVKTWAEKGSVVLTVQDTGTGMSEEILSRIFLPFFTTKDIDQGTGLGLAVVHGIVKSHDGTINVRSKPGKGTTFEVRFPLRSESSAEEKS